jgi:putative transposase
MDSGIARFVYRRCLYVICVAVVRWVRRFSGGVHDLGLHVVWCSKYRRPVLDGRIVERLERLVRAKAEERGWEVVALEVMPGHVHLFVEYGPKSSASYVANQFKGSTSRVEEFRTCGRSFRCCGHRHTSRPRPAR